MERSVERGGVKTQIEQRNVTSERAKETAVRPFRGMGSLEEKVTWRKTDRPAERIYREKIIDEVDHAPNDN